MARRDEWIDDDVVLEGEAAPAVRPFLLTGGRTQTTVAGLEYETLVERIDGTDVSRLRFESAQVVDLCDAPLSVAEVSAHLSIPLGTAMVLVGDLVADGHLEAHHTYNAETDAGVGLLTRIIAGVKQL